MPKRRPHRPVAVNLYAKVDPYATRGVRQSVAEAVQRFHAVKESAPAVERSAVREATVGGARATGPGRMMVRLIAAGWSLNSNHYGADVLREAAANKAWPRGTKCYVDHASEQEEQDHPSGSVKNLAAMLTEDARWDEASQSLVAEVRLFEPWRNTLTDMAESIGMSIRAWVTGKQGERDGREGFVVDWVEGRSVDFVTTPAAGGEIISVLEAVGNPVAEAANLGAWLESRLHLALTTYADEMYGDGRLTREERIVLSGAIGDGLQAWTARVESDAPQLFQRSRWSEPEPPDPADTSEAAAEAPTEPTQPAPTATAVTEIVTDGAPPSAPSTTPTEEEPVSGTQTGAPPEQAGIATVPDAGQPPTVTTNTTNTAPAVEAVRPSAESQATDFKAMLAEALKPFQEQVAAMQAANEARTVADRTAQNRQAATEAVTTALRATEHADVTASIASRVTSRVVAAVPTTAEGVVDGAKLTELIGTVVADEAEFVRRERANALAEAGVGLPYGMGSAPAQEAADDGLDAELTEFFSGSLGLSTEAARVAAKGRG